MFVFTCSHPVPRPPPSPDRDQESAKWEEQRPRQTAKGERQVQVHPRYALCCRRGLSCDGLSLLMSSSEISSNSPQFWSVVCKLLVLANDWVFLPPKVVTPCTSTWVPKTLQYIVKSRRWSWRNIRRQGRQSRVQKLDNDDPHLAGLAGLCSSCSLLKVSQPFHDVVTVQYVSEIGCRPVQVSASVMQPPSGI